MEILPRPSEIIRAVETKSVPKDEFEKLICGNNIRKRMARVRPHDQLCVAANVPQAIDRFPRGYSPWIVGTNNHRHRHRSQRSDVIGYAVAGQSDHPTYVRWATGGKLKCSDPAITYADQNRRIYAPVLLTDIVQPLHQARLMASMKNMLAIDGDRRKNEPTAFCEL